MLADRLEEQLPVDTVEEGAHIEIEHPVVAPTALASLAYGIDRRFADPVPIGVGVEHRPQHGLQAPTGHPLGNAICDSWNTQRPRPTIPLRNIDPPHRRRKITPGRQPVPELVEVARKVGLELRNRLSISSSRSLVGLHTLED